MFATIGKTIDQLPAANFVRVCFAKMGQFSKANSLPSRVQFMYKDLIDTNVFVSVQYHKMSWDPMVRTNLMLYT